MTQIKIGTKLKCIADKFEDESTNPFNLYELNLPVKGNIYTIREIIATDYGLGLRLEEIHNKEYYFSNISKCEEPIFGTNRFEVIKE